MNESLDDVLLRLRGGRQPRVVGDSSVRVTGITHDSRAIADGSIFCCVPGGQLDGHQFAEAAVAAGATVILVERLMDVGCTQLVVDDVRVTMGFLAAALYRHPCDELVVVGVTGTNGKTTTTHLLASIFNEAGQPAGVIGTLAAQRTTPEATELQARLRAMADDGMRSVMMEVSSHALVLFRVNGCRFHASVFTNLGHDHLDLHRTQERYFAAKASLFEPSLSELGIVNADDVHGQLLLDTVGIPTIHYSAEQLTDIAVTASSHSYTWEGRRVSVPIGGRFNVMNSLAAATTAKALGVDLGTIVRGLANATPVPGRFETVDAGQAFSVVVDYAHTPDALGVALSAAREVAGAARVIVVFGCGGDRDERKRGPMGKTAAGLSDLAIVTSDNPRTEDPMSIIEAIISGVPAALRLRVEKEPDRRAAIARALGAAQAGDVVVIAGKGHEATQTIGTAVGAFDDRVVATEILETLT